MGYNHILSPEHNSFEGKKKMALLVSNVAWTKDGDSVEALCKHLQIKPSELLEYELLKRSVDARRRPQYGRHLPSGAQR